MLDPELQEGLESTGVLKNKILYLDETKDEIHKAIEAKLVDVPDNAWFCQYPELIRQIVTPEDRPLIDVTITPNGRIMNVYPEEYEAEPGKNAYAFESATIAGDANLYEDNIKSGVTIYGITGTFEGETPVEPGGDPETDPVVRDPVLYDGLIVRPADHDKTIIAGPVPEGEDPEVWKKWDGDYTGYDGFNPVKVLGDEDLIPENIKIDVELFGITGILEPITDVCTPLHLIAQTEEPTNEPGLVKAVAYLSLANNVSLYHSPSAGYVSLIIMTTNMNQSVVASNLEDHGYIVSILGTMVTNNIYDGVPSRSVLYLAKKKVSQGEAVISNYQMYPASGCNALCIITKYYPVFGLIYRNILSEPNGINRYEFLSIPGTINGIPNLVTEPTLQIYTGQSPRIARGPTSATSEHTYSIWQSSGFTRSYNFPFGSNNSGTGTYGKNFVGLLDPTNGGPTLSYTGLENDTNPTQVWYLTKVGRELKYIPRKWNDSINQVGVFGLIMYEDPTHIEEGLT